MPSSRELFAQARVGGERIAAGRKLAPDRSGGEGNKGSRSALAGALGQSKRWVSARLAESAHASCWLEPVKEEGGVGGAAGRMEGSSAAGGEAKGGGGAKGGASRAGRAGDRRKKSCKNTRSG